MGNNAGSPGCSGTGECAALGYGDNVIGAVTALPNQTNMYDPSIPAPDFDNAVALVIGGAYIATAVITDGWSLLAAAGIDIEEAAAAGAAANGAATVPSTLARVIPGEGPYPTLGIPGAQNVFVTDADAIAGMNAQQLGQALAIQQSDVYSVYTFANPMDGLASPIAYDNPLFVGGGYTAGGAPEYLLPNGPIPPDAVHTIVR